MVKKKSCFQHRRGVDSREQPRGTQSKRLRLYLGIDAITHPIARESKDTIVKGQTGGGVYRRQNAPSGKPFSFGAAIGSARWSDFFRATRKSQASDRRVDLPLAGNL